MHFSLIPFPHLVYQIVMDSYTRDAGQLSYRV